MNEPGDRKEESFLKALLIEIRDTIIFSLIWRAIIFIPKVIFRFFKELWKKSFSSGIDYDEKELRSAWLIDEISKIGLDFISEYGRIDLRKGKLFERGGRKAMGLRILRQPVTKGE